jgi:hypothetical protein
MKKTLKTIIDILRRVLCMRWFVDWLLRLFQGRNNLNFATSISMQIKKFNSNRNSLKIMKNILFQTFFGEDNMVGIFEL